MNNTDFLNLLSSALNDSITLMGSQFVYNSTTYTGIINDVEIFTELKEGGLQEDLATVIVVSKTVLSTKPSTGQQVTVNAKAARILKVVEDELSYTLTCITATR